MAVRTTSNLAVALTPFRKGRLQNTAIGSSSSLIGGTPLLSSMKRTLAFTPSTPMFGKNALASASTAVPRQFPKVANMNPTHASNPATLLTSAMPPPPPSVQAEDDQSKPASTTKLAEPSVGLITESTSNPVFETIHADGKDSTISTTNKDDLNDGTTEAILATTTTTTTTATRELQMQLELVEKSKQEFHDMSERVRREMREEYAKLETLQKSMDDKYGTLQTSMDTYSRNMASCAHDHELTIRTLVSTSMHDLRQESCRATDAISTQVHEQVKAFILPSDIRTLVETETRYHLLHMLSGMVDSAKSEFQQWIGGVVKNVCMIGGGFVSGESPGSFAFRSTALGGVDNAIDNVASGLIRDPLLEPPRNAVVQHDTANDKDACARVGDPIIQRNANDDNQLFGCKISTASHLDGVLSGTTPVKSILPDLDAAAESSYDGIRAAKDTTPCERKKDSNTSSLTPIPRSSMSTWTTPFSRKATPLKNNYAKNKLLGPSNSQTHRGIASEVKLDNLSILGKLPEPPSKLEQYQPASAKSETSSSSSDESPSLVAVSTSGSKANVRVVMNASPNESIPTVKRTIGSTPKDSKRKTYGRSPNQTLVNITSKTVNSKDDRDVTAIDKTSHTKKVHAKHQRSGVEPTRKKVSRKRDQSEMTEDKSISPRRSKRQREAHRVRPVASGTAVVCGNRKPCKVTPKEDQSITPIVKCNYDWLLDADSTKSNSVDHASTSNRYDSLLGTSVTVPTATATTQNSPNNDDDNLFGLDDGNMEFSQRSEKRSTLTSLLPFVNGFGHRSSTKKTFSKKKRAKHKISAPFDFEDFNFS